jgi:hypothetical protein
MSIRKEIKRMALKAFPRFALKVLSVRSRRLIELQARALGLDDVARQISVATRGTVAVGPFAGMRLDYECLPVHSAPKFLGTYERELHSVVERAIRLAPPYILNIGCAEGFYAVGLALRLKNTYVFAGDADPKALRAVLRNAELNGVSSRVSTIGIVQSGQLHKYLKANASLLVMDCEGAEFHLLDPCLDPVLLCTNILVEIHPEFGSTCDIVQKFSRTHNVVRIDSVIRKAADISIPPIPGVDLVSAANERRGDQTWLFLEQGGRSWADSRPIVHRT